MRKLWEYPFSEGQSKFIEFAIWLWSTIYF